MRYRNPLKQILSQTRSHWDRDQTRPSVRQAFRKALLCRTPALGAEVYASENQERVVFHTCKSRACPSCGHRATIQWQRERWAAMTDQPYKGITFTMPDVLWQLFHDNPGLVPALSVLAPKAIETWVCARYGLRVGVIAILHTFNGRLEFNSHVHTMVTPGGLHGCAGSWVASAYYDRDRLMEFWRDAVIHLLRAALRAGQLRSKMTIDEMEALLTDQEKRWWSIKIQSFKSKEHFLRYAGRYVRRPPIAQHRITNIEKQSITFWTKDKRLGCRIEVQCSPEEFIDRWAQHLPEHYQHAVRCFGLYAPRTLGQTSAAVFALLGQKPRSRPRPVPWAVSIERAFGRNPLLDDAGNRMNWVRRLLPEAG
jgi:Putative transposase/Transposase zinc-binding domain